MIELWSWRHKKQITIQNFLSKKNKNKVLHWHPSPSTQEYALIYIKRKQVQISLHADIIASCRYCKIIGKKKCTKENLKKKIKKNYIFSFLIYFTYKNTFFIGPIYYFNIDIDVSKISEGQNTCIKSFKRKWQWLLRERNLSNLNVNFLHFMQINNKQKFCI